MYEWSKNVYLAHIADTISNMDNAIHTMHRPTYRYSITIMKLDQIYHQSQNMSHLFCLESKVTLTRPSSTILFSITIPLLFCCQTISQKWPTVLLSGP